MGSTGTKRKPARVLDSYNNEEALNADRPSALEENVQAIKRWEKTILLARSKAEQVSDWIVCRSRQVVPASWDAATELVTD
jgi:hypothetical protein